MGEKNILTSSGLKALEEELTNLEVNKRREIAEKLKEARAQGDLSENAEYDAAKDEQAQIEARIAEIHSLLKNSEVIDESEADANKVNIGCKIRVLDETYDEELEFQIVGSTEANSLKGKISNQSPLGAGLLGHQVGEVVSITTPGGAENYKILSIERNV
ncbi:MAG: transcription elongation factor GreA [Eubacteriales bacterium]|nr:transcription elongation factor GreA [Eubacteriales bacterium]